MNRILSSGRWSAVVGLGVLCGVLGATETQARLAWVQQDVTEDVLYLTDGRVLRGKILSESRTDVRFEIHDRRTGLKSAMTIFRDQIREIKRGVPVEGAESKPADAGAPAAGSPAAPEQTFDPSIPSIYVVPFKGEMATDIFIDVYRPIIEDIKKHNPTCIVFRLDSDSSEHKLNPNPRAIEDYLNFEEYRRLVHMFKDSFRDTRQVMWIAKSKGVSSIMALAWNEIYMEPNGVLDGLNIVHQVTAAWQDPDVRAKMQAAWAGIAKGFVEHGRHDLNLAHAMMFPNAKLSADFKGRNVVWKLDDTGEVVVDSREDWTPTFLAEDARNLRISQETVEPTGKDNLADLAFILGYREYRKCEGIGESSIETYITKWRDRFAQTEKLMLDIQDYRRWATGDDEVKYLGSELSALEKIIAAMNQYKAIEREWERRGVSKLDLELRIRQIRERIKEINNQNRDRGRGTGGGGGGGRGPGLPGGGG
ncbi:MAG: hypothetical protein HRU76_10910 [Phycisphaeraceae bacterium]|nr:MAG: hypothetical protein HRU76_10910 [Phycisphaeraceae bacterium]